MGKYNRGRRLLAKLMLFIIVSSVAADCNLVTAFAVNNESVAAESEIAAKTENQTEDKGEENLTELVIDSETDSAPIPVQEKSAELSEELPKEESLPALEAAGETDSDKAPAQEKTVEVSEEDSQEESQTEKAADSATDTDTSSVQDKTVEVSEDDSKDESLSADKTAMEADSDKSSSQDEAVEASEKDPKKDSPAETAADSDTDSVQKNTPNVIEDNKESNEKSDFDKELTVDNGEPLSQGQRQLLSLARAAVTNAPILVLDEATSSVDSRTEMLINNGLDALMKDRTVLVIAHRLSTIKNADKIVVLDKGCIVESGTYAELMERQGVFYNMNR